MARGFPSTIVVLALGLLALAVSTTAAQGGSGEGYSDGYPGVRGDGTGSPPRSVAAKRASKRLVTWAGFEMLSGGGSRFFMQVSSKPQWKIEKSQGRIEVVVLAARIHMRNNRRPLETRFFATPVRRARLRPRGRNVALVLEMRAAIDPQVSDTTGADGFHFVRVDFPAGDWGAREPTPR